MPSFLVFFPTFLTLSSCSSLITGKSRLSDENVYNFTDGKMTISGTTNITKKGVDDALHYQKLKEVVIFEGITTIGDSAFEYKVDLSTVLLPESLTTIGRRAFFHCDILSTLKLPESVMHIEEAAFGWTSIGSIEIPSKVKEIGKEAFQFCTKAATIVFREPSSLEIIGGGAFMSTAPKEIILPKSVIELGPSSFSGCVSLKSFIIPLDGKLKTIGEGVWSSCELLNSVKLPASATDIRSRAFRFYNGEYVYYCGSKTYTNDYAFTNADNLKKVFLRYDYGADQFFEKKAEFDQIDKRLDDKCELMPTSSPKPTPLPSETPTPKPTPHPTKTPSPKPTPKPTPLPSKTPEPTPYPTPSSFVPTPEQTPTPESNNFGMIVGLSVGIPVLVIVIIVIIVVVVILRKKQSRKEVLLTTYLQSDNK